MLSPFENEPYFMRGSPYMRPLSPSGTLEAKGPCEVRRDLGEEQAESLGDDPESPIPLN